MKKIKLLILIILPVILLTGCNKKVFDFNYNFNKAYCNYNNDKFELSISNWTDYEGEQIQIESDGKTYLISTNNCYLVKE